jgi:hypothetical protein
VLVAVAGGQARKGVADTFVGGAGRVAGERRAGFQPVGHLGAGSPV